MKSIPLIVAILTLASCGGGTREDAIKIAEKHADAYCKCIETENPDQQGSPITCYTEHLRNFHKELDNAEYAEEDLEEAKALFKNKKELCEMELNK